MSYTRANPSPRYRELQQMYRQMHEQGETFLGIPPDETFPGKSLLPQAVRIKRLIEATGASTILDYGSGKGRQYEPRPIADDEGGVWPSMLDYWDVDEVVCYDPCYKPYSTLPSDVFDGVVCTDVLEHCPEEDMFWIVGELFAYARRFVYANVACYPASKRLPSGENAHCTIKPLEWWADIFQTVASQHREVTWEVWIESRQPGSAPVERKIGNT